MLRRPSELLLAFLSVVLIACPGHRAPAQQPASATGSSRAGRSVNSFATSVQPFLAKYCTSCHGATKPKAGLNLAAFTDDRSARAKRKSWERVREYLEGGVMPPEDKPQPARDEVERVVDWIKAVIKPDECGRTFDPGRVTIRRLNRAEYNNTIRDLVGVDFHPADDFPSDDVGYGFDNIGDVLSLPPVLLERYLGAAERISEEAIVAGRSSTGQVKTWNAEELSGGSPHPDGHATLSAEGDLVVNYAFPREGNYVIRVRAGADQAGKEPAQMAIRIDGKDLKHFTLNTPTGKFQEYHFSQKLRGGPRRLAIAFLNDYYDPNNSDPKQRDRNLHVASVTVEGPQFAAGDPVPESHRRIIFRTPKTKAQTAEVAHAILERFASRAFRRPVTEPELARLVKLVNLAIGQGDSFERGIQVAIQAVLVSPEFLFRVELDSRGRKTSAHTVDNEPIQLIGDFELASRLSYFLWSSIPDDELWRSAVNGSIRTGDTLEKQVRRMIHDPKAQALVENFAGQWLQLRNVRNVSPDRGQFPGYDEKLRDAMVQETEHFFGAVVLGDMSILEFLDADFTYLNEQLARHYKIAGVRGEAFRRVKLKGRERGGLITQASILTVTSNPTRTSPVKRGRWVLEQLLGTPPPPPPPNVPTLKEEAKALTAATVRRAMEQHRAKASCAVCHSKLDPLGFGLENFNAVGGWRDQDGGVAVDASGTLPSGESFRGPKELKAYLKGRTHDFVRCLTEKMLTYALGRGLEEYDRCAVEQIVKSVESNHYRFSALVTGIVKSDPFQKRRG